MITSPQFNDTYDENKSRIEAIDLTINEYRDDYNILRVSELELERQRTLKGIKIFNMNTKQKPRDILAKSLGNVAGSLSINSILGDSFSSTLEKTKSNLIKAGIREARAGVLSRGIGPLEEIPVSDYIEDHFRMLTVTTTTQIGPEQRLMAKLSQLQPWTSQNGRTYRNRLPIDEKPQAGERVGILSSRNGELGQRIIRDRSNLQMANWNVWVPNDSNYGTEYNEKSAQRTAGQGFTFSISNQVSTKHFPAHIENINESVTPSWEAVSIINRSEDLYIYNRASRDYGITFWVVATHNNPSAPNDSSQNNPTPYNFTVSFGSDGHKVGVMSKKMMWDRINFLHQCTRPSYSNGTFLSAPYCKLVVGDLFNHTCTIESLNIDYDPLIWDINYDELSTAGIKPMIVKITMNGKIIHNGSPDCNFSYYPTFSPSIVDESVSDVSQVVVSPVATKSSPKTIDSVDFGNGIKMNGGQLGGLNERSTKAPELAKIEIDPIKSQPTINTIATPKTTLSPESTSLSRTPAQQELPKEVDKGSGNPINRPTAKSTFTGRIRTGFPVGDHYHFISTDELKELQFAHQAGYMDDWLKQHPNGIKQ